MIQEIILFCGATAVIAAGVGVGVVVLAIMLAI